MTDSNMRTLRVLLPGLVAFILLVQLAAQKNFQSPLPMAPAIASFYDAQAASGLDRIPSNACAVSWVNGGNYVLATPRACNGVRVLSMTIGVSAKSCSDSASADFRQLTNSTLFKGEFGFYLGQNGQPGCLVVQELRGQAV